MKKHIIILFAIISAAASVSAQTPDTIQWIHPGYHYSCWYDSCSDFLDTIPKGQGPRMRLLSMGLYPWETYMKPEHVDRPTKILGAVVTEPTTREDRYIYDWEIEYHTHTEEYVYLMQKVDSGKFEMRDSARWDTAAPKYMKIALNADTGRFGFKILRVYEARFNTPVTVDSTFYLYTSKNGDNERPDHPEQGYVYKYLPVMPMLIYNSTSACEPAVCYRPPWHSIFVYDFSVHDYSLSLFDPTSVYYGMHFAMVDYVNLTAASADTAMGTAYPTDRVSRDMAHTIEARPRLGYRFSHWNDGDSHAVRTVYVTSDTTFTAYFGSTEIVQLDASSADYSMGTVTGGGRYNMGDTVYMEAVPAHQSALVREGVNIDSAILDLSPVYYYFSHWNDGDTTNPRRVALTQDTAFTAYFSTASRLSAGDDMGKVAQSFTLAPNPAHGEVTLMMDRSLSRETVVIVIDVKGHEVHHAVMSPGETRMTIGTAHLAKGTYFVTLATSNGTTTRKLTVE